MCQFAIAPGVTPYTFAVARLPGKNAQPGRVSIFVHEKYDEERCGKNFFKADEVALKWSPKGSEPTALLIETLTHSSGSSYYGESNLYLMHADGKFECTVPFGTEVGQIQDAQWSPKGKEFVVIQGKQPAQAILFRSLDCKPVHHFGRASMNTIRWNPQGRFLLLGGFGNCPGVMTFWDRNKKKPIAECQDKDSPRYFEWLPDGRSFLTATPRPQRTVDNGYKIWSYYGKIIHHELVDRIFQVAIRPAPEGTYPDRAQSPHLTDRRLKQTEKPVETAKPKAYIPPSLRKLGVGPSNIMKQATDGPRTLSELEKQIKVGGIQGSVPGGIGLIKSAYVVGQGKPKVVSQSTKRKKKKKQEEAKKAEDAKAEEEAKKKKPPPVNVEDKEAVSKRLKALKKKQRQIEQIKEKQEKGEKLDDAQLEKLSSEKELLEEIEALEKLA